MCALAVYLITVLSYSYGIIMDSEINAQGHGKNVFDGLNTTEKRYLKGKKELIGKLASNYTKNIGMIPSASKDVSIKFVDQYINIPNNKEIFNGLKGRTKKKNHNANINHVLTMFKGTLMLITEV